MVKEMTKQDKVREGIAKDLAVIATRGRPKYAYYTREDTWQAVLAEGIDGDFLEDARLIIVGLNAEGCVLKVEELPKYWFDRGVHGYTERHYIPRGLQEAIEAAGYVAVESIIPELQFDVKITADEPRPV